MRLFRVGELILLLIATTGLARAANDPATPAGVVELPVVSSRTVSDAREGAAAAVLDHQGRRGRCADQLARRRPRRVRAGSADRLRPAARAPANQSVGLHRRAGARIRRARHRRDEAVERAVGGRRRVATRDRKMARANYVFRAIQGTASDHDASAGVTTRARSSATSRIRDIEPLLTLVERDGPDGEKPAIGGTAERHAPGLPRRAHGSRETERRCIQGYTTPAAVSAVADAGVRMSTSACSTSSR